MSRRFAVPCAAAALVGGMLLASSVRAEDPSTPVDGFHYINTRFENASPLYWQVDPEAGLVRVYLLYDHERSSPNRAAGHWHFQVEAEPGSRLTLELHNFDNVWNGRPGSPVSDQTICVVSTDGSRWRPLPMQFLREPNRLRLTLEMQGPSLYVARMEPYTLVHLERLLQRLRAREGVHIETIGHTLEGRPLEMVRVGDPTAPHSVVLRGRAHPWEAGGSWVLDALLERLARDDASAKAWRRQMCVYVLPMANKDGVVRGWTRFNLAGKDLNRDWDRPADENLAPENHALESWLVNVMASGRGIDLLIDFHNDEQGRLHLSRPAMEPAAAAEYLARMRRLETALRHHTWFSEGHTPPSFSNPGSIGEGLLTRYGVTAVVHELNANHIAGLDAPASAAAWRDYGERLPAAFLDFFQSDAADNVP